MRRFATLIGLLWLALAAPASAAQIFLTVCSSCSWTVPQDWNNLSNTVEVIGGGAYSTQGAAGRWAGGGGAYSKNTNVVLTPGASVTYTVGAGGDALGFNGNDTWFVSTGTLLAKGGTSSAGSSPGGQAASGVGTLKYSGGNGTASAGGGAAGPHGAGENGEAVTPNVGGRGDAGFGGAGGNNSGGGNGTEFNGSHGAGGGGGLVAASNNTPGGQYGGGGGRTSSGAGLGGDGLIVITYTPRRRVSSGVF